jgi:FtsZ-interacting cell division protein ZipA
MRAVKVRVCALVILALAVAGCSSSSGDATISSLNERVATLNSRVEAADDARASAERERDDAQKARAAREAERDAAKAERDAPQVQLDARQAADQTSSPLTTAPTPSSVALCTPEVLRPVVAGLFPENDRWNIVSVQIAECRGGYVRLFGS